MQLICSNYSFTTLSGLLTNGIFQFFFFPLLLTCLSSCSLIGIGSYESEILYTVRAGDTLSKLAYRYDTSVEELISDNNIDDPTKLKIGQTIVIRSSDEVRSAQKRAERPKKSVKLPSLESLKISLRSPLSQFKVISRFGQRKAGFHEGLDLRAAEGDKIYAAHAGLIIFSGKGLSGYGNMIAIKGNGYMTLYAHNSSNLVVRGDTVETGQEIGLAGSTGRASGPHLHFELRILASDLRYYAVDPLPLF